MRTLLKKVADVAALLAGHDVRTLSDRRIISLNLDDVAKTEDHELPPPAGFRVGKQEVLPVDVKRPDLHLAVEKLKAEPKAEAAFLAMKMEKLEEVMLALEPFYLEDPQYVLEPILTDRTP